MVNLSQNFNLILILRIPCIGMPSNDPISLGILIYSHKIKKSFVQGNNKRTVRFSRLYFGLVVEFQHSTMTKMYGRIF